MRTGKSLQPGGMVDQRSGTAHRSSAWRRGNLEGIKKARIICGTDSERRQHSLLHLMPELQNFTQSI